MLALTSGEDDDDNGPSGGIMEPVPTYWYLIILFKGVKKMTEQAERINGWAAMIGIIAAIGSYAATGQIIPGIWWYKYH